MGEEAGLFIRASRSSGNLETYALPKLITKFLLMGNSQTAHEAPSKTG